MSEEDVCKIWIHLVNRKYMKRSFKNFQTLRSFQNAITRPFFSKFKQTKTNVPQGMVWRRRMQNLNPFGQQEIYETKLQKFSNLRELSKCQNSVIFSKFKKTKKLSPGNGLKKAHAKFEDDRAYRSNRKRLWKMRYQKWNRFRLRFRLRLRKDENFGHFTKSITFEPRRISGRGKRL